MRTPWPMLVLVTAVAAGAAEAPPPSPVGAAVSDAIAVLAPTQGQQTRGTIRFRRTADGVRVTGEIAGLPANTKHGFHVHEFGDCSAPDAASAGGHFAPDAHPHGAPDPARHHAGDMGNVESDAAGVAKVDLQLDGVGIATGERALVGRAVIVHAQPDDLETQPTGNAGARIACGVIGVAKPGS